MSTIKLENIQTRTGSGTITIGASGETVALGSGVTSNLMYPAFEAYRSSSQSIADSTNTKVQYDTEVLDTNGYYDNTTNYRFTPLVAGKYFVYVQNSNLSTGNTTLATVYNYIYKNGSLYKLASLSFNLNYGRRASPFVSAIIDMNGTTDYLEGWVHIDDTTGTGQGVEGNVNKQTYFGAYRIGS